MPIVVCQKWATLVGTGFSAEMFEVSYGFSLHLTARHLEEYLEKNYPFAYGRGGSEYPKPEGKYYFCLVDEPVFSLLRGSSDGSQRFYGNKYPEEYID
ncbi:MAG: hypothetical protein HY226_00260 [Candidatus Vogelbacteria bacterium]|nr:hypothetical protein [Candidatus Vogelbacteria bacterium]